MDVGAGLAVGSFQPRPGTSDGTDQEWQRCFVNTASQYLKKERTKDAVVVLWRLDGLEYTLELFDCYFLLLAWPAATKMKTIRLPFSSICILTN